MLCDVGAFGGFVGYCNLCFFFFFETVICVIYSCEFIEKVRF